MVRNYIRYYLFIIIAMGMLLNGCIGTSQSSSSNNTPVVNPSFSTIIIDPMTSVPVMNGSSTQGTLYIHNYGSEPVSNLQYNLNNPTISSQVKSLLSRAGFNMASGIEDSNGFVLLNPERCQSIGANSSCAINFSTPNLSFGNQGSSLVTINYTNQSAKSASTSQVVNYNYVDGTSGSGVNFTGSLEVNGVAGTTRYVVGYLYAGSAVSGLYKGVNLVSSNPSARITGGFINNQEVATNQVIAVEFAVAVQNTTNSYVNITPRWSQGANISVQAGGVGAPLALSIVPSQNVASYIFGNIPILVASPSTTGSISVVNNGTANGSAISVEKSGGESAGITIDASNCASNPPPANAASSCTISYTVTTYAPGSTTLIYKSNSVEVGRQVVYWMNSRPIPAVKILPSPSNVSMNQGESSIIEFAVQNIGNTPLDDIVINDYISGTATWIESSGASNCGSSLGVNAACTMVGKLVASSDGTGVLSYLFDGSYNSTLYGFLSLPVRYIASGTPNLVLTPVQVVNVLVLANGESSATTIYNVSNTGNGRAIFDAIGLESMANLHKPVISNSSTCRVGRTLNVAESCTVIVMYGPESASISINESGSTRVVIDSHGGTPTNIASQLISESYYYRLVGNDAYAVESISTIGLTGSNPYSGTSLIDPMYIDIVYTNPSVNYPLENFNLNTNNLPYGILVDNSSTCKTGESVIESLAMNASCSLRLRLDRGLLAQSPQAGSSVISFTTPKATWTTPLGAYAQAGTSVEVNYLQPTVSFSLSDNKKEFESTVLSMMLSNESAGVSPFVVDISGVKGWLESAPISLSDNCTVDSGTYAANCSFATGSESAQIKYLMPAYFAQAEERAMIPLFYTSTDYGYLNPKYSLINFISIASTKLAIFVTESGYTGNLGGAAGADAKCNADSNKPALPVGATYKALLQFTDGTTNNATITGYKYYRTDRTTLIATATNGFLTTVNLTNSISTVNTTVWTGGADTPWTCTDWTLDTNGGYIGSSINTDINWRYSGAAACDSPRKLYCVEQP